MSTDPSISVVFTDGDGVEYDLTTRLINFERMRLREEKRIAIILKNRSGNVVNNVVVNAVAHPTAQLGNAAETYNAMAFCLEQYGTFVKPLSVGTMGIDEEKTLWLKWSMPETAIPGYGQFAIEVTGDVIW